MISYISGIYSDSSMGAVVIECSGVGFLIRVPETVLQKLPAKGSQLKLHTYLHVKEDAMQLYGFLRKEELELFEKMIGVSGIGPKGALAILSTLSLDTLRFAIYAQDAKTIAKAPGIGLKTAQKMILELKDKIPVAEALGQDEGSATELTAGNERNRMEAIEALVALGYGNAEAAKAVRLVQGGQELTTEAIIKAALRGI